MTTYEISFETAGHLNHLNVVMQDRVNDLAHKISDAVVHDVEPSDDLRYKYEQAKSILNSLRYKSEPK